jgi:hypothetical protein
MDASTTYMGSPTSLVEQHASSVMQMCHEYFLLTTSESCYGSASWGVRSEDNIPGKIEG